MTRAGAAAARSTSIAICGRIRTIDGVSVSFAFRAIVVGLCLRGDTRRATTPTSGRGVSVMSSESDQSLTLPRQDLLDEIVQRVVRVVQPRRILLFGSAARGRLGPDSDLDLLVIVREPVHRRAVAQEIYRNLHGILL
ncbi:MAG: nucleotidyltransferase domain-containing protein, partial [Planctomycetota bacterium]